MTIFITTNGDRSVGIFPHQITILNFPKSDDREVDRTALQETFTEILDEECSVRFSDECEDCGRVHKQVACPIIPTEE